ncbi:hypothetical protein ACTXT7_015856 [Hymenolepis weldensis]
MQSASNLQHTPVEVTYVFTRLRMVGYISLIHLINNRGRKKRPSAVCPANDEHSSECVNSASSWSLDEDFY